MELYFNKYIKIQSLVNLVNHSQIFKNALF